MNWCDKFMAWMTVLSMKGHAVLDLTRKRKGELVYDFGCWLQWLWDGGVQDTERRDEGKQQDSSLGLQESEPWPARAVLARITWETTMEGGEFQDRCLVSNFISSSLKNGPFQWAGNQESSHCDRTHTRVKKSLLIQLMHEKNMWVVEAQSDDPGGM